MAVRCGAVRSGAVLDDQCRLAGPANCVTLARKQLRRQRCACAFEHPGPAPPRPAAAHPQQQLAAAGSARHLLGHPHAVEQHERLDGGLAAVPVVFLVLDAGRYIQQVLPGCAGGRRAARRRCAQRRRPGGWRQPAHGRRRPTRRGRAPKLQQSPVVHALGQVSAGGRVSRRAASCGLHARDRAVG